MSSVPTISKSILTDRNSVYTSQDMIELVISPEEVPLLNTSQGTYLKFLLTINSDAAITNCLANPDPMAGGTAIIQTISIYSNSGQLLEQLEDVNTWTAMYYHYSKSQGNENMRTLLEGVSPVVGDGLVSQYWTFDPVGGTSYKPVECVIPLYMSGLLGQGQKLLPIVALNGIRIRIQLAKNTVALRALTQLGYSSTGATYTGIPGPSLVAGPQVPQTFAAQAAIAPAALIPFIDLNTTGPDPAPVSITGYNTIGAVTGNKNCAYLPGQDVWIETIAPGVPFNLGPITSITVAAGPRERLNFAAPGLAAPATGIAINAAIWVDANSLECNFTMSNVELICSVVEADGKTISGLMNQVSQGGGIRIDYPSYNLYRQNLQNAIPRSELLIPCTENRAMSIVSEPMRSIDRLYQNTLQPVGDSMTSYIWNIANRLTPNRRVNTIDVARVGADQELSWNAIHLHETEKSISRCDISARNLVENARCFVVGRELAKSGHSFDANTNEIRLNVEYGSAAGENIINKLVDTWVYHIRTVTITPNSVAVNF